MSKEAETRSKREQERERERERGRERPEKRRAGVQADKARDAREGGGVRDSLAGAEADAVSTRGWCVCVCVSVSVAAVCWWVGGRVSGWVGVCVNVCGCGCV